MFVIAKATKGFAACRPRSVIQQVHDAFRFPMNVYKFLRKLINGFLYDILDLFNSPKWTLHMSYQRQIEVQFLAEFLNYNSPFF